MYIIYKKFNLLYIYVNLIIQKGSCLNSPLKLYSTVSNLNNFR